MKKLLPDLIAILAFVLLSFAYFFPADIENRILFQHDTAAGAGAGQEVKEYYEQTGERSRWTNSLFGGMPMYQIAPSYDSTKSLQWVQKAYQLFLPDYVCLTFMLMLGFYILLRVFGIPVWLAGLGGIMWAFSSYFFILISAGHIWKFITLAYVPPTIAGIVLAYRGKLLWGGILTALFVALQITSNHVQTVSYTHLNTDTGSAEAQIALFSYRIAHLTEHLKLNRKDYSTERALTMLVGKRRALLTYLKDRDITRYRAIVKELGLRK